MPRPNNRYYDLLEVTPDASARGIKQSYKRIVTRLTAKASYDESAAERLEDVEEAWAALCDPAKRKLYHEFGEAGLDPEFSAAAARPPPAAPTWSPEEPEPADERQSFAPPPNYHPTPEPWGAPAGPPPGYPSSPPPAAAPPPPRETTDEQMAPPPADMPDPKQLPEHEVPSWRARPGHAGAMEIWVPFRKACLGGEGEVMVAERIVGVSIPVGVEDGHPMEVDGVSFVVRVENDPQMWRDDLDIYQTVSVDRFDAEGGTEVTIRILEGYMKVNIPEGIQTGQKLRLKGRGIHKPGEEPGHMYLTIAITGSDVGRARVRKKVDPGHDA